MNECNNIEYQYDAAVYASKMSLAKCTPFLRGPDIPGSTDTWDVTLSNVLVTVTSHVTVLFY